MLRLSVGRRIEYCQNAFSSTALAAKTRPDSPLSALNPVLNLDNLTLTKK